MNHLLKPPEVLDIPDDTSLVFLAGPIQGASDWQTELGEVLLERNPGIYVATPRRDVADPSNFDYAEQKAWELRHLRRAARLGVVAFWFAAQDHSLPYTNGRAYAQTTRIEWGKVTGWLDYNDTIKIVAGFDPLYIDMGGGSETYVRDDCKDYCLPVQDTLGGMIKAIEENLG